MNYFDNPLSGFLCFDPFVRKQELNPAPMGDPRTSAPKNFDLEKDPVVTMNEDGSLNLQVFLPQADTLSVAVDGVGSFDLSKGDDGYFRTTIMDYPAGFHYVYFTANGIPYIYPYLPLGYGAGKAVNYIDLPVPDAGALKQVPHGSITREIYFSELTGGYRTALVYTPASYKTNTDKRYPVLYIQHGGGEDEIAWFLKGRIHYLLDNMIAEGKCQEMIVVANHGSAMKVQENGLYGEVDGVEIIAHDCVPYIDASYRTIADPHFRAGAGLSAGAGQARHLVHRHPDLFKNLGAFSSGQGFMIAGTAQGVTFDYSDLFETTEKYNSTFDVTFVVCGDKDPRAEWTREQASPLAPQGYNIEYREYPGGHEWNVWRAAAADFLQMIFK